MQHKELALALTLITACGGGDPITGPDPLVGSEAHLYGVVTETPTARTLRPVSGAVVEVAGLKVMTLPDGTYDIRSPALVVGAGVTVVIRRGRAQVAQRHITLAVETRADFEIAPMPLPSLSGIVGLEGEFDGSALLDLLQPGFVVVEDDPVMRGDFGDEFDRAVHPLDHDVEVRASRRAFFGDALLEATFEISQLRPYACEL